MGTSMRRAESMPIIQGSTSRILCELFKLTAGVTNLSSKDPVLKMAVATDARLANLTQKLITQQSSRLNEINEGITASLTALKSNTAKKTLATDYEKNHQQLATKIPELAKMRTDLNEQIKSFSSEEQQIITQLLRDRNDGKKSPEEARQIIQGLEKKREKINHGIDLYVKNNESLEKSLIHLLKESYAAVPEKEKVNQTKVVSDILVQETPRSASI